MSIQRIVVRGSYAGHALEQKCARAESAEYAVRGSWAGPATLSVLCFRAAVAFEAPAICRVTLCDYYDLPGSHVIGGLQLGRLRGGRLRQVWPSYGSMGGGRAKQGSFPVKERAYESALWACCLLGMRVRLSAWSTGCRSHDLLYAGVRCCPNASTRKFAARQGED